MVPLHGSDNYHLGREIARGGMGSILEAEDLKLSRTVAAKVALLESEVDEVTKRRFQREAEVLAQLAHPNIVPIYDIVWEGGVPLFYTMKLVKGRTLQTILNDLRKEDSATLRDYPLNELLDIFRKSCDAIAFAHSKGVLHRDIKPDNIMVGEFGEVLVMDWGLAKLLRSDGEPDVPATSDSSSAIPHPPFLIHHSAAHSTAPSSAPRSTCPRSRPGVRWKTSTNGPIFMPSAAFCTRSSRSAPLWMALLLRRCSPKLPVAASSRRAT